MNGALKNISQLISASLIGLNWLGGKDSNLRYRIQSPGPYDFATAHPRTSPREVHRAAQNRGSIVFEWFRAATFGKDLMIFSDDFLLDHSSRLIVDRMSDVLIGSVFAFFAGHRDEKSSSAMDDLKIPDHEAVIESDGNISP